VAQATESTAPLPPLDDIRERLARNQRERRRLRTMLRWIIDDMQEKGLLGSQEFVREAAGRERAGRAAR
jgi:hypothetical protein